MHDGFALHKRMALPGSPRIGTFGLSSVFLLLWEMLRIPPRTLFSLEGKGVNIAIYMSWPDQLLHMRWSFVISLAGRGGEIITLDLPKVSIFYLNIQNIPASTTSYTESGYVVKSRSLQISVSITLLAILDILHL